MRDSFNKAVLAVITFLIYDEAVLLYYVAQLTIKSK